MQPTDDERQAALTTALRLMRLALPLLDRAGVDLAACRLQHAIDTAEGNPVGEEIPLKNICFRLP